MDTIYLKVEYLVYQGKGRNGRGRKRGREEKTWQPCAFIFTNQQSASNLVTKKE